MKQTICLLGILLAAVACSDHKNKEQKNTADTTVTASASAAKAPVMTGYWYRHYTGTIGTRQVIADIFCYGGGAQDEGAIPAGGTYRYADDGQIFDLAVENNSANIVTLTEAVQAQRTTDENAKPARWEVTVAGPSVTGKWRSADGGQTFDIALNENYNDSAYPFDVLHRADSASATGQKDAHAINTEYTLLVPSPKMAAADAEFITAAWLKAMGGDTLRAKNFDEFIQAKNNRYFSEFKKETAGASNADRADLMNWQMRMNSICEYNNKGILVVSFNCANYTGGAHENFWSTVLNLDVPARKVLTLDDVVAGDKSRLSQLLTGEARKQFKTAGNDNPFLSDAVAVTNNFILSDKGLTFHYSPGEITGFAYGEVSLFIPYSSIADMLQPDFKRRMKL